MAVSRLFRDWQGKHLPPIPAGTRLRFGQDTFRIYAAPWMLNCVWCLHISCFVFNSY